MQFKPHNYQRFAISHIINKPSAGLFLDMGLGKTVCALTAISNLLFLGEINKVLVIAPLRVAKYTWEDEINKWDHLSHLRLSKVLGTQNERLRAMRTEADIYVINRENTEWLVDYTWIWDMVIIDELSSFKSSKSNRFRALRKVKPYIKRIVGLTGTPAPNSLIDLWPQIYLLDGGQRLGKTFGGYKERYFSPGWSNGYIVYTWILKDFAQQAIEEKISDICISMKSEDYLDVPERLDNIVSVILTKEAMALYKKLEKEFVLSEEEVSAAKAAVLTNKLLQISNGAVYDDHHEVHEVHDEKLKALFEVIEAANGQPILIFYNYKHDFDRIINFLKKNKIKAQSLNIEEWNKGNIPIMVVHPASAGHGLNLQYGGNIIIWFGLTWSLELYQQANARLHRQGQTKTVIIHHLICKGTIDEDVMRALKEKDVNQEKLLRAIKARIRSC